jgi:predicted amidophosphoribosyltransferase
MKPYRKPPPLGEAMAILARNREANRAAPPVRKNMGPGRCDRCGQQAPRGTRICRPCRKLLAEQPVPSSAKARPTARARRRASVRVVLSGLPTLGRRR